MSKRKRLAATGLLLLVAGALVSLLSNVGEPAWHGRALSHWLHEVTEADDEAARQTARLAVRETGTNGIPTLLRLIQSKPGPFKTKLAALFGQQHLVRPPAALLEDQRYLGVCGFELLGLAGRPALPALTRLAANPDAKLRNYALQSMVFVEPDWDVLRPVLVKLGGNPDAGVSANANYLLHSMDMAHGTPAGTRPTAK